MERIELEEVQQLLVKLAHITGQIENRNAEALRRIETSSGQLERAVMQLHSDTGRFAQATAQAISEQAQTAITQGASPALERLNKQLEHSTQQAKWAADALAEQRRMLSRAQNTLVWKGLTALAIGSLLAAGGSAFVAWKSMREIRQAEYSASILRAARSGSLTHCGQEQALCVKAGRNPRRTGAQGEYILVEE